MHRIIFRGKSIKTGKWIYGYHVKSQDKDYIIDRWRSNCLGLQLNEDNEIDSNTLSQSLAVGADKNENFICEGDIIEYNDIEEFTLVRGVIEYTSDTFVLRRFDNGHLEFFWDMAGASEEDFEVIGNKWDNPEMMECLEKFNIQKIYESKI